MLLGREGSPGQYTRHHRQRRSPLHMKHPCSSSRSNHSTFTIPLILIMSIPSLLVVGGNGFLGSAICKGAVAKGWNVASIRYLSTTHTYHLIMLTGLVLPVNHIPRQPDIHPSGSIKSTGTPHQLSIRLLILLWYHPPLPSFTLWVYCSKMRDTNRLSDRATSSGSSSL